MRALLVFALAGLLALSPVSAQDAGDGGQFTIGVDVDLVVFNLTVTDSRGRQVSGLTQSNFRISEEGRPQQIKLFRPEDVPATIGLIIDSSGSMRNKLQQTVSSAIGFVGASNPQDEMFVISFNEKVYLGLPSSTRFTSDPAQVGGALGRIRPEGLTALYDALAAGLEHLKGGANDRKALVLLSDGADNASSRKLDDIVPIARQSGATIYTIGIYDVADPDKDPGALRKMAELTGGRSYFPKQVDDLGQVWLDIAGGIRSQYTIGYVSSNPNRDGAFRKVRVTASGRDGRALRVSTREGYTAAGPTIELR